MDNSRILGFYYVVFQTQFNNYVKCWIDGEENYSLYTEDEFLDFASKVNDAYSVRQKIGNALCESAFFLWDVDNNEVMRISPGKNPQFIRKELLQAHPDNTSQIQPVSLQDGVISLLKKYIPFL